jgi:hypothetical protein
MRRLLLAMAAYVVLAGLAFISLKGEFRLVVLIIFGGLAAKTWIGHLKESGG